MKQVASLRYGVIFKKAFCDPEVFKGFVRDILGIQLEIDTVETEKTFSILLGRVQPRFDLFAEDKKNRNDKTPLTYREWLQAINDSLDEQVEETHYHLPEIQKIFQHIAKDLLSSQERTRMIEEYHLEELKQSTAQQKAIEIASNLLTKGLPLAMIAEVTGLSVTEILTLAELGK